MFSLIVPIADIRIVGIPIRYLFHSFSSSLNTLSMLICWSGSLHWWEMLSRIWSQLGHLVDWPFLGSSSCSLCWLSSQRQGSPSSTGRLISPSSCWIRNLGDARGSIKTLRGGTLSTLNFFVIWPPPWLFESKIAESDVDGKQRLPEKGWEGSFWAEVWGRLRGEIVELALTNPDAGAASTNSPFYIFHPFLSLFCPFLSPISIPFLGAMGPSGC